MSDTLTAPFSQANKPTVQIQSPFELMRAAGENARLMNDNRLFQAQQAAGLAQQNAIDPATGQYSPDKFRQNLLAAGPVAAPAVQSAMGANQSLSTDQLEQAFKKTGWVAKTSAGALADPNFDYSDASMMKLIAQGSADGVLTMPEIVKQLSTMPPDAAGRKQWLAQHQSQALSQEQQLELQYGKLGTTTGPDGKLIGTRQDRRDSGLSSPPQPGVQTGPSAEWLSQGTEITNADGSKTFDSNAGHIRAGRISPMGAPMPGYTVQPGAASPPAAPSGPPSTRPAAGLPGGAGPRGNPNAFDGLTPFKNLPPMLQGGLEGQKEAPQTPSGPNGSGTTVPANLAKLQGASVDHYVADSRESHGYQDRIYPLQQAAKALETAKTGEGSDVLQSIASRIQTMTPDALKNIIPNIRTPDEIAAYDEARKYLTMAQQNRPGAGRTDAADRIAGDSSPSTHISPAAAKLLVQAQMGVERSRQAQLLEFNATHPQGTEGQYDRWLTTQAAKIDPRAFITDLQTPAERKSYYDRLGKDEQENYLNSYNLAKTHKLLTLPNGG